MAKKQIKHLVIQMSSTGGDSTVKLINSINTALKSAQDITKTFNREVGGSVKVISNIAREFSKLDQSIKGSAKNIKTVSSALNSLNTKTGVKALQGFVDGVELATLYVKDLAKESKIAEESLRTMIPGTLGLEKLESQLSRIIDEFEELNLATRELVEGSRDTVEGLDLVRGRLSDVETQIKKNRIQTEIIAGATGETAVKFDALGNAILKTSSRAKQTVPNVDKLTNSTRRLAGSGSQGARAFSDLAFKMNPLVSLYATIAVNVYALSSAFSVLNNAASLDRLYNQTAAFASTLMGINVKAVARDMEQLSKGAINAGEAIRQATRGLAYGFSSDELRKLTELGRKASIALGIGFEDAIDRAIRGIAKQEVEVLDEIGVVTRLESAAAKYAKSLGIRADALTDIQKRIALTEEVIRQQEEKFSGIVVESSGYELLAVSVTNALDSITMAVARATDSWVKSFANTLEGFRGASNGFTDAQESYKIYSEALKAGNINQATVALHEMNLALARHKKEIDSSKDGTAEMTKERQAYLEQSARVKSAQDMVNVAVGVGTLVLVKYAASMAVTVAGALASVATKLAAKAVALWGQAAAYTAATAASRLYGGAIVVNAAAATSASLAVKALSAAQRAGAAASVIFTAALVGTRGGFLALGKAAILATAPIAIFVAKAAAIGLVIGAVGAGILQFVNYLTGGKFLTWALGKAKDMLDWLGSSLKRFLEWLGKSTGIGEQVNSSLGLIDTSGSVDEVRALNLEVIEYFKTLGKAPPIQQLMDPQALMKMAASARENILYMKELGTSVGNVGAALTEMNSSSGPLATMVTNMRSISQVPMNINMRPEDLVTLENQFKELQEKGVIKASVQFDGGKGLVEGYNALDNLQNAIKDYERNGAFNVEIAVLRSTKVNDPFADLEKSKLELKQINALLSAYARSGSEVNVNEKRALEQKKAIITEELRIADIKAAQRAIDEEIEIANISTSALLEIEGATKSAILAKDIESLENQIERYTLSGIYTAELERQLRILNAQKAAEDQIEAARLARAREQNANELAQGVLGIKAGQAGSETAKVEIERQILELKEIQAKSITDTAQREAAVNALILERINLEARASAAKARDFSTVTGSIANLEGLTSLQSTFASSISNMSGVWADFQEQAKTGSSNFMDYLKGNLNGLATMAQASVGLAQQAFATMSQAKVDGINREIEAEKRRDGKSAESKAKIKALEAKRIKEEAKAKKASVIMSTAMAVMQALAQLGPIAGPIFGAAITAMGVFQLGQIDKAASGQLAGLNDGGGNLSISGGNRSNSIDVSKTANAGELAYLQGKQGSGTAQNFTPGRAGGGFASAGTSMVVGESGPEIITPAVPVNVERSGKSGGGSSIVFSPQYNLSSVDTQGMEELLERHSTALYKGLEKELLARNLSLENL